MLTRAGFELAPSGHLSASLPVKLSSPPGLDASSLSNLNSRDILATTKRLPMRGCAVFQLRIQNFRIILKDYLYVCLLLMMPFLRVLCWAIIFITKLRFQPGESIADIYGVPYSDQGNVFGRRLHNSALY